MRTLFLKALAGLTAFDVLLVFGDFAMLHKVVANWKVANRQPSEKLTGEICNAVDEACSWYPKRALCLQRASVTTCLLRNYGIPAAMVIGNQKLPFKAHAWVEVHGTIVNERTDVRSTYQEWVRC